MCMEVKGNPDNKKSQSKGKTIAEIEDRIMRDIKNLSEQGEDHYKPVRADNFYINNSFQYESIGDRNKNYQSKSNLMKLNHTWNIS